jgi:hypothetical protein
VFGTAELPVGPMLQWAVQSSVASLTAPHSANVLHNPDSQRFKLDTPAGAGRGGLPTLGGVIIIYHTEVPLPVRVAVG